MFFTVCLLDETAMHRPSLMIFLAAMEEDRWIGSMKMLSASEPEITEKRSDTEELCEIKHTLSIITAPQRLTVLCYQMFTDLGEGQRKYCA